MTHAEQIAWLRETARLRALQTPVSHIRDQMKRVALMDAAHREELAKRQPQIDWLTRKLARGTALLIVGLLSLATAHAQQPWGRPYAPPPPPAYRGTLPSWVPPTLPPGSPGIIIPMPADPPPPPPPWRVR